jgi:hypothetical protein
MSRGAALQTDYYVVAGMEGDVSYALWWIEMTSNNVRIERERS